MKRLLACLALFTAACGWLGSNPKRTVSKYLQAVVRGDYEAAYERASGRDRAVRSLEQYVAENSAAADPLPRELASRTSYEIRDVTITGERATASVALTHPDAGDQSALALEAAFKSAHGVGLQAQQLGPDAPTSTTIRTFQLIKEEGGWKVFLGWEAQVLAAEARRLQGEGRFEEAQEKFDKALEIDPDSVVAREGRDEIALKAREMRSARTYMTDHMEVIGFKTIKGRGRPGSGYPGTTLTGRLLNNGHRTLSEVEVTVYFLSGDGKLLAEKKFYPVSSQELSLRGEKELLRRGYVKEFGYVVEGKLPPEWAGNARAEITWVQFEETD